jgi:hypothetical protein
MADEAIPIDTTGMMLVQTAVTGLRMSVQLVLRVLDFLRKVRSM